MPLSITPALVRESSALWWLHPRELQDGTALAIFPDRRAAVEWLPEIRRRLRDSSPKEVPRGAAQRLPVDAAGKNALRSAQAEVYEGRGRWPELEIERARVLVMWPEVVDRCLLPAHATLRPFFERLVSVVIGGGVTPANQPDDRTDPERLAAGLEFGDEAGATSEIRHLVRRLLRLCRHYRSRPRVFGLADADGLEWRDVDSARLKSHLTSAAYELPFGLAEEEGTQAGTILRDLERDAVLYRGKRALYWIGLENSSRPSTPLNAPRLGPAPLVAGRARGERAILPLPGGPVEARWGNGDVLTVHLPGDFALGRFRIRDLANLSRTLRTVFPDREAPSLSDCLFLDTETTGLTVGLGTYVYLVGLGRIVEDGFEVRQHFLSSPESEGAFLGRLARTVSKRNALVTFHGRGFDLPHLSHRFRAMGLASPFAALAHRDLGLASRCLWQTRFERHRLVDYETNLLGFTREGDIQGADCPRHYVAFLKTRAFAEILPVFVHNLLDILSVAFLGCVFAETLESSEDASESFGRGRLAALRGDTTLARACFLRAAERQDELGGKHRAVALFRMASDLARWGEAEVAASLFRVLLADERFSASAGAALERLAVGDQGVA